MVKTKTKTLLKITDGRLYNEDNHLTKRGLEILKERYGLTMDAVEFHDSLMLMGCHCSISNSPSDDDDALTFTVVDGNTTYYLNTWYNDEIGDGTSYWEEMQRWVDTNDKQTLISKIKCMIDMNLNCNVNIK